MYSQSQKPELKNYLDPDLANKLESSKDWYKLTELQKKICLTHWLNPTWNKTEIAKELGCSTQTVYSFFNTPVYNKVALEIDRLDFIEIRRLAIKALKAALVEGGPRVAGKLAVDVLRSEGIMTDSPAVVPDSKVTVSWGSEVDEPKNTLPPPP